MVNAIAYKQHINNWPWPAECPPVPWTAEQQRRYAEDQLKRLPDAPMMQKCL